MQTRIWGGAAAAGLLLSSSVSHAVVQFGPTSNDVYLWLKAGMPSPQQQLATQASQQQASLQSSPAAATAADFTITIIIYFDPSWGIELAGGQVLEPGDCIEHHETHLGTNGQFFPVDDTVCLPSNSHPVPLGHMKWPLGVGLLAVGAFVLLRRRPVPRFVSLSVLGVVLSSLLSANDAEAIRLPDETRPRCDYKIEQANADQWYFMNDMWYDAWWLPDDGNNWWHYPWGMLNVFQYANDVTGYQFSWGFWRSKWNTNWSELDLPGTIMAQVDTTRQKGKNYIARCEIEFDVHKLHDYAVGRHQEPSQMQYVAFLHEFGHCLGLGHFTVTEGTTDPSIGITTEEQRLSVMNYASLSEMDWSNAWETWIRYSDEEIAQATADLAVCQ